MDVFFGRVLDQVERDRRALEALPGEVRTRLNADVEQLRSHGRALRESGFYDEEKL